MPVNAKTGITILGLGPGDAKQLTIEAKDWLCQIDEIYLRTLHHPTIQSFPTHLKIHSFDDFYEKFASFEEVYAHIVEKVLDLGQKQPRVTYAVPGHPLVAEATCPEIIRRARETGIPVRLIVGMSFIEPVLAALEIDPFPQMMLIDALELGAKQYPPFSPDTPVIVAQIYDRMVASEVKMGLTSVYPDDHPVQLVHNAGAADCKVEKMPLFEIDRCDEVGLRTVLYLPPLEKHTSFEAFQELVGQLRAPGGCPWDRKQTHDSLRRYLLEETYELLDALDQKDEEKIAEELGDLLLQILLHAQIGIEEGEFSMTDVLSGIHQKIVRRHPHVFGNVTVEDADGVVATWEQIKAVERAEKKVADEPAGRLESVPAALPALSQAQEIQARAAHVGFDWEDIAPVHAKILEEIEEVRQADGEGEREVEIGDLLFAVVNLSRWLDVDAETALRYANRRFKNRFRFIERRANEQGRDLKDMTLAEMDLIWDEAKRKERTKRSE